jgi:EAL domain-containing protein (putative c-di-GMP-specific phosphodiesterase class I)/GGDEF domain-containing protein
MSLIKQLWLSVITMMVLAFGGSFIITMIFSKNYLEEQLQTKNLDNANSLALSMSQMDKDPVGIDLLIAAQFDSGHYTSINLVDPQGNVISERIRASNGMKVPGWFTRLIPIEVSPGKAQIQDGWSQYGTLTVVSDVRFAYEALWHGCLMMLSWILGLALASGIVGTFILRVITRPLRDVVSLAEAIGDRRFIHIEEPRIEEFRAVTHAMNLLSSRIKKMLDDETQRLEQLRLDANYDQVSGLMNRSYFGNRAEGVMNNAEKFTDGVLVIAKLRNLSELDKHLGHNETNQLIKRLGDALNGLCESQHSLFAGRLKGTDFGILSEVPAESFALASQVKGALYKAASLPTGAPDIDLSIIASGLRQGDNLEQKQKLIDTVAAKIVQPNVLHVIDEKDISAHLNRDEEQWHKALTTAIKAKRVKLGAFPVREPNGDLIHYESPVRMAFGDGDEWSNAGQFLSWAMRFDMMSSIDALVLECAFDELKAGRGPIGLNISDNAIKDQSFISRFKSLLRDNQAYASNLWLEVPEQGVFDNLTEFRNFCEILKPMGCKVGIEHAGHHITRLGELHNLGIDYIKIDVSVIHDIHINPGNQAFLKGLCLIAHTMGMITIAEGVRSVEDLEMLPDLGIDGMTGPAVKA